MTTPTPWEYHEGLDYVCVLGPDDVTDDCVATFVRSVEDAELIVTAVNNHARLLEAVKLALDYYRAHGTGKFNPYEVEQTLEQALALAGAK